MMTCCSSASGSTRVGFIKGPWNVSIPLHDVCLGVTGVARTLWHPRRFFVEHSADPKKWRSPEKAEVKRRHPGVRLGSDFVRLQEQAKAEQRLVDADKFTDWNMVCWFAAGTALLLVLLNLLLETVEPNPTPEYTPYDSSRKLQ